MNQKKIAMKIDMDKDKLTPIMKEVLLLLSKSPMTDKEISDKIPNFSLELLGELRRLEAIDHYNNTVYITSKGEELLKEERKNRGNNI